MNVNDQFNHGHMPIRPLAFRNKDKAVTSEFMIDYGGTGEESYHMYITDVNDPSKVIDLTELMLKEILPSAGIDANKFTITIDGEDNSLFIKDIIEFIYKRFIYTEAYGDFDIERDKDKIINADRKDSLLRDLDGNIITPITLADNVLLPDGSTLQDTYSNNTRVSFHVDYFTVDDPTIIRYGSDLIVPDFDGYVEVRYNGIYLDRNDYIYNQYSNESYYVELIDPIKVGDKIDVVFMYNSIENDDVRHAIDGHHIAIESIPTSRLEKFSDSIYRNDCTSIATSKAVNDLLNTVSTLITENNGGVVYCTDKSAYNTYIHIDHIHDITAMRYCIVNVLLRSKKRYDCEVLVHFKGDAKTRVPLKDFEDNNINCTLPAGRVVKLLWDKDYNCFRLLSTDINQLRATKYIHKCYDSEEVISYDEMDYYAGAVITVYKNGLRLFEDIDYAIDPGNQTISLFTAAQSGDIIIFEALSL